MQTAIMQGFRLSPQQRHLWPLLQGSSVFSAQCVLSLVGPLDAAELRRAFDRVVARHEALRTCFRRRRGEKLPLQIVAEAGNVAWRESDLTAEDPAEWSAACTRAAADERSEAFDLEAGPLLRLLLLRGAAERHALVVTLPALAADPATLRNLLREAVDLYARRPPAILDDEVVQYLQFSEWQQEMLESEEADVAARDDWRQKCAALPPFPALPGERPAGDPEGFASARLRLPVEPELATALESASAACGVSIEVFLLAAWTLTLACLTGEPGVTVRATVDGRPFKDLQGAFGLLGKTLPLQTQVEDSFRFEELAQRVGRSLEEACGRQESFDSEAVNGAGERLDADAVDFEMRQGPADLDGGGVAFSLLEEHVCWERFKLKLLALHRQDALALEVWYDESRLGAAEAGRVAAALRALLAAASAEPKARVGDLDLLGEAERSALLVGFNATRQPFPAAARGWHELFEAQAESTPESPALACEGERLTYRELNARANRLARRLRELGVGPEARVALWAERSLELVVGLLAVLKSGGAYVPLDPSFPPERVESMLADAGARVVLAQSALLGSLDLPAAQVVPLDDPDGLAGLDDSNLGVAVEGESLAYVLFTSGSTGRPKGVAVEHRQLVDYVLGVVERLEIGAGWSFAVVSTFAADLGNTAIFPALTTGGCLHVVPAARASDPDGLGALFAAEGIDCLKIVPSHLGALLSGTEPAQVIPRRLLVLGGEKASWELIRELRRLAPGCRVVNHYGPTESTVGATARPVEAGEDGVGTVPLGRPLPNAAAYVLDRNGQPLPAGVAGELYLGGMGLARGYLGQPGWTAERFVPDPFGGLPGARLYRTGDLVRHSPAGELELQFLGRVDHQVKLRGFRIELGEIEAVLRGRPEVREAVAVVREEGAGGGRLVAYVVGRPGQPADGSALLGFLRQALPDYMVPAALVVLPALPLTANGKVDRRALPAPETGQAAPESYVAPRTAMEASLAEIWASVLGVERIGVTDNFFELGGDSILAIQVIARANRAGLALQPRQIFQHQTIADLAPLAGSGGTAIVGTGEVRGEVELTPIQRWFFEQRFADPHHWNQSVLLRTEETLDLAVLEGAVRHLLAHHDALRMRFTAETDGWRQVCAPMDWEGVVPVERVDLSTAAAPEAALEQAAAAVQASLDLANGPLIRVTLFDLGAGRGSRLLLVVHHLVVDGVSWRILLEDLETAVRQLAVGEAVELPPRTTSFQTWAQRLAEHAASGALEEEVAYWTAVAEARSVSLPVGLPDGESSVGSTRAVSCWLDAEETRALLQEVPATYHTQINDVLLAGLALALGSPLAVELEGHGREDLFADVDLTRTVGWFTTHFPVLLDAGQNGDPGEALKGVKEQLRQIPQRGIGYGLLRSSLRPAQEPQIGFNYLGQFDQALAPASLFRLAAEEKGPDRSPRGRRSRKIEIIGRILGGRLQITWLYSGELHRPSTVEGMAQSYLAALRSLIEHCLRPEAGGFTPSDFPLADLDDERLARLSALVSQIESDIEGQA